MPLQNGAGNATAFVVTTFDALGLGARGLGGLDDGLSDRGGGASRTVTVIEALRGSASHFGYYSSVGGIELEVGLK